jgi:hypothetical protein
MAMVLPVVWDGEHTSCPPSPPQLAQGSERRADLAREELGLFPGGEVATPVDLVEVGQVGVRRYVMLTLFPNTYSSLSLP